MSADSVIIVAVVALPAILLMGFALVDVVITDRLSTGAKIAWVAAIALTLLIGTFAYLVTRPLPDRRRTSPDGGSDASAALIALIQRKERDEIDAADFRATVGQLFEPPVTGTRR